MGLREDPQTIEYLVDLVVDVQTVSSCITAPQRDPEGRKPAICFPVCPTSAAGKYCRCFKARQRITEILRILPGSSLVVAPADTDLADPEMAAGLENRSRWWLHGSPARRAGCQMGLGP